MMRKYRKSFDKIITFSETRDSVWFFDDRSTVSFATVQLSDFCKKSEFEQKRDGFVVPPLGGAA